VFEQVLPDGSTVPADLPRRVLWVPSSGQGAVVPRPTASKDDLIFRLSLVSPRDGSVLDSAELSIPVIGNVVIAPQQVSAGGNPPTMLSAASETVAPGGEVVLNWDAGDADSVVLRQTTEDGPTTLYIELPPSGSMTVPLPETSADVTFTMRAYNAEGEVTTEQVSISPETPPSDGGGAAGGAASGG
jgi:hypothetical protein